MNKRIYITLNRIGSAYVAQEVLVAGQNVTALSAPESFPTVEAACKFARAAIAANPKATIATSLASAKRVLSI
jgi:hypothetical protein